MKSLRRTIKNVFKLFMFFMLCIREIRLAQNIYRFTCSGIHSTRNFAKFVIHETKSVKKAREFESTQKLIHIKGVAGQGSEFLLVF